MWDFDLKKQWYLNIRTILFALILVSFLFVQITVIKTNYLNNSLESSVSGSEITYSVAYMLLAWGVFILAALFLFIEVKTKSLINNSILTGLIAINLVSSLSLLMRDNFLFSIWMLSLLLLSISFFCYLFPTKIQILGKNISRPLFILIVIFLYFCILSFKNYYSGNSFSISIRQILLPFTVLLLAIDFLFGLFYFFGMKNDKKNTHRQILTIGFLLSFPPLIIWVFLQLNQATIFFNPWIELQLILYPILIAIFILEKSLGQDYIYFQKRTNIFFTAVLFFGIIQVLLHFLYIDQFDRIQVPPLFLGFTTVVFSGLMLFYLRKNVSNASIKVEENPKTIKPSQLSFSTRLEMLIDKRNSLIEKLKIQLQEKYLCNPFHYFLKDDTSKKYLPFQFSTGSATSIEFSSESHLVKYFEKKPQLLIINGDSDLPDELLLEKEKIHFLGANFFLPVNYNQKLYGWVAFKDQKLSKSSFEKEFWLFEKLLFDLAVTSDEISQQMEIQQQIKNLNILNRVVQGVNYTLGLDDIYELIYAQTTQIFTQEVFFILLQGDQSNNLKYVFCVEGDERISEKESQIVSNNDSFEATAVNSGLGSISNDYPLDCQKNNFPNYYPGIQRLMIVPLNTGAKTIGCIVIGSEKKDSQYTEADLVIFQSIADLVAGAIEKTRLLAESETHAKQLAILNNLARKVTSTLDVNELFKIILKNSVDLVNCEEARLVIVDDKSHELIYQDVFGEHSLTLKQERVINPGKIINKVLISHEPLIENNLNELSENLELVSEYDFPVRSIGVIPLVVKDQLIGLIELINRKGNLPFTQNDLELVSALAAQSAIAIENARLYQRTDQELEKRVQELSVMQRIDRDLNTALDLQKVMEITLAWALRQSKFDFGWIGTYEENTIQVISSFGYEQDLLGDHLLKDEFLKESELHDLLISGMPVQSFTNEMSKTHPDSQRKIILPIRRNEKTISIISLESRKEKYLDTDEVNFLMRLGDHASIAIINSQLYAEVQAANQAKSEFVSLVAHELKNPMTSIKGYTELLASGTVGPINSDQANFLKTIRKNSERMNTLVSDLNDLSKIETGNLRLEQKPVELDEIIQELLRSVKGQIEEKEQNVSVLIAENFPTIFADPNRLQQILINLLSNAIKYTQPKGEIFIKAEIQRTNDGPLSRETRAHIMVSDNGAGISEEDMGMIFQKFFRSEDPRIRASSGTGLGLNITRSLVEMQGGQIWFESKYQQGTTFHITLPFAK